MNGEAPGLVSEGFLAGLRGGGSGAGDPRSPMNPAWERGFNCIGKLESRHMVPEQAHARKHKLMLDGFPPHHAAPPRVMSPSASC